MKIRRNQESRGIALVIILLLLLLVAFTSFMMATFGSETRHQIAKAEHRVRCSLAAESALSEARESLRYTLLKSEDQWGSFLKGLIPPYPSTTGGSMVLTPTVSKRIFTEDGFDVSDVQITCVHRRGGKTCAQGLLGLAVEVCGHGLKITYKQRLRFRAGTLPNPLSAGLAFRPTAKLLPGHESVMFTGGTL